MRDFSRRFNKRKKQVILMAVSLMIIGSAVLFAFSHSKSLKYNDWWIVGNHIEAVQERYGTFDRNKNGTFTGDFGKGGTVGYYLGEDNGWLDPTYNDMYYWIHYNAEGIVQEIYVATLPGG